MEAPTEIDDVVELAMRLASHCDLVVRLGADGALVCREGRTSHVPAPKVDVVDTTAAGDSLCGALADGLARGLTLEDATQRAVKAAAITVTRSGAQQALPTADELQ